MSIRVIASEHLIGANNDLRAQNERQCKQLASLNAAYERMKSKREQLEAENAKLRELVHAFDWCTENFDMPSKCEHCPLSQSDVLNPECEVRMRELRMEVPE